MSSSDLPTDRTFESDSESSLLHETKPTRGRMCVHCGKKGRKDRALDLMIGLNILLLLLSLTLTGALFSTADREKLDKVGFSMAFGDKPPGIVYSPANKVEKFKAVRFQGSVNATNPWKGLLSEELDKAWIDLYEVGPIPVTADDLQKIGKTSIEIPSRPGYHLGKLAVFHQLHCLDRIRRYVHNDHYHMDDSDSTVSTIDHIDHCVDIIRQVLTCKSDTTLLTFQPKGLFGTDPDFDATHSCANFEVIHDWAKEREINMTHEWSEHPEAFQDALVKEIDEKLDQAQAQEA